MPKAAPAQTNFSGGEFSPLLYGRVDLDRYKTAMATCLNYIPTVQGGLPRRPGTKFMCEVKDSTKTTRLIPFEYSTTQAYVLEVGDLYIRPLASNSFVTDTATVITAANIGTDTLTANAHGLSNGQEVYITGIVGTLGDLLNNRQFKVAGVTANTFTLTYMDGTAVDFAGKAYTSDGAVFRILTITTTYAQAHINDLKFTQSADVLYITHPSYPPKKLSRTSATVWTLTTIAFLDGPYLEVNTTTTTLTPGATSGSTSLTASAVAGINGGAGFATTDVGRIIRFKDSGNKWKWMEITAWTSTTVVTVLIKSATALTSAAASSSWRLGEWSATTGYPACVVFHEDRLTFAGCTSTSQRIDGSNSGDYENFAPSDDTGSVVASNAIAFTLNSGQVNAIRWLSSDEKGLLAGTVGGEWLIRPSSQGEAISATQSVSAKQCTSYGSSNASPLKSDKSTLFISRSGQKIREMNYFYDVDGFRSPDLSVLAEHITAESGFQEIFYQKEPQSVVWAVLSDGGLASMTFERDTESLKVGWARHEFGGVSDTAGTKALVKSGTTIPTAYGMSVYLIIERRINGRQTKYVEFLTPIFNESFDPDAAYFLDGGKLSVTYGSISDITQANPAVVTITAHGFSNGDAVLLSDIYGMTELNEETCTVANATANTFELSGVNSTGYGAYISGGFASKFVTTVSNLWHLEGQSVSIYADGAVQPNVVVSGGVATLTSRGAVIQIGLGYNSDGKLLRLEAGSQNGTALGKTRRTHRCGFLLHRTLGLKVGTSFDSLDEITFREASDPMSRGIPLFSGIKSVEINSDYDFENQICWRQSDPTPGMILAVMPQVDVQDRQ